MAKVLHAIGLAAVLFLTPPSVHSAGPAATPEPPAATSPLAAPAAPPAAITAAEVIAKSSEVTSLLGTLAEKFAPSAEIEKIERSLPEVTRQIDLDFTDTSVTLGEQPPLTTIQAEQARWQYRHLQVTGWLTVLTQRAVELRTAYDALSRTARTWTQTRDAVQAEQAPAAIVQQVISTLGAIEAAPGAAEIAGGCGPGAAGQPGRRALPLRRDAGADRPGPEIGGRRHAEPGKPAGLERRALGQGPGHPAGPVVGHRPGVLDQHPGVPHGPRARAAGARR